MKILITGARGTIGQKLIDQIKQLPDYQIKILIQSSRADDLKHDSHFVIGDLTQPDKLYQATLNTDIVVHLAGITHTNNQSLYYKINFVGTKNLLEACQKNKIKKFIFISSRAASHGGGAYARSKLLAEQEVEKSKLDWVILKPAEVYGATKKDAIYRLTQWIKKNKFVPIIGDGKYLLSPVFIDDVVDAIIKSIQNNNVIGNKYILAGPESFSYKELVDRISKIFDVRRVKVYLPLFLVKFLAFLLFIFKKDIFVRDQIPRLLSQKSSNIDSAKNDLDFNPKNFETGIKIN